MRSPCLSTHVVFSYDSSSCKLYQCVVTPPTDHPHPPSAAPLQGPCGHCGVVESPQWRSGPPEAPVLCDQCGRHFRKTKTLPKRKRRSLTQHFAGGVGRGGAAGCDGRVLCM
jgi:hypothetical protein